MTIIARLGLIFLVTSVAALAQDSRPAVKSVVERIIKEELANGRAYEMLGELCRIAPARLAGTENSEKAVQWAKAALEKAGADVVRLERCLVPCWKRGDIAECVVVEPKELAGEKLPILALGGSVATPEGGITAEVIEAPTFEKLRAIGEGAKGKIVLFNEPMDRSLPTTFEAYGRAGRIRGRGAIEAARVGAVAALTRSLTTLIDDQPHTGAMNYDDTLPKLPAAAISTRAAERLAALLLEGKKVVVRFRIDCKTLPDVEGFNVVADLLGRESPDEIVLVGGHLDSWDVNQGAHDDGAGCVQSIETLRLLKAMDLRPRRTLRVVLFANEENGLRGALAYLEAHRAELGKHVAAIETDSGGFTPRGFSTDSPGDGLARLRGLAAHLEALGADRVTPGGGGADIGVLVEGGVPLIGLRPDSSRYFDFHHAPRDNFDGVNERELESGAAAVAALAWLIAEEKEPLPRNPVRERRRR